jgi:DNA-binding transcriptional ArsR family regulator
MKHLDVLEAANLVIVRREGRRRWNHLNPVPIQRVCDRWVSRHVRDLAGSANRLKERVEGRRPARRGAASRAH